MRSNDRRPSTDCSRRRLLRRTGALGASLAAGTAGCLSLPPLGGDLTYGRLDVPAPDDPSYRRWLPAPALLEDAAHYGFTYAEPAADRPGTPPELRRRFGALRTGLDYYGVGFDAYDGLLATPFGTVIEASFDRASVTETLLDSGFSRDGRRHDYDLFGRTDVRRRVAVGDDVILRTSEWADSPDIEALISASRGERTRYHEADEDAAAVIDAIGASPYVIVAPDLGDPLDRAPVGSLGFRFDDDTAYKLFGVRYPEDRVPTVDQLEEAYRDAYYFPADAAVDVELDGRLATAESTVPLATGTPSPQADIPQVTWGATHDADAETLTVRHEAGERVAADWLWYDVETADQVGNEVEPVPLWRSQQTVGPGDAATVDLSGTEDLTAVNLVYSSGGTDFAMLFTYEVSDR